MPTTKKRINVTLSRDSEKALRTLAERDNVPEATKAAALLDLALDVEEDRMLDAVASERFHSNTRWIPHEDVWKK